MEKVLDQMHSHKQMLSPSTYPYTNHTALPLMIQTKIIRILSDTTVQEEEDKDYLRKQ